MFQIFGGPAEFERAPIRERMRAGLAAGRAQGRVGGRRKRLGEEQRRHAVELLPVAAAHGEGDLRARGDWGISRSTLYAYVEEFAERDGADALVRASR